MSCVDGISVSAAVVSLSLLAGPRVHCPVQRSGEKTRAEAETTIHVEKLPRVGSTRSPPILIAPSSRARVEGASGQWLDRVDRHADARSDCRQHNVFRRRRRPCACLTTRFSTRQVLEDTSEARRKLEAELEKHQIVASKLVSDVNSLQKNIELLSKLEAVTEKGKHTGDEVIAMAKYVMEQRSEKAKEMVAIHEAKTAQRHPAQLHSAQDG